MGRKFNCRFLLSILILQLRVFFKQFLFSVALGENLVSKSSLQVQETGQGEGNGRTEST